MAAKYFLAKTDPETYSFNDFEKEKKTVWDGVKNAQALQAIRAMEKGDLVFIYHSVKDAAVVGLARSPRRRVQTRKTPNWLWWIWNS